MIDYLKSKKISSRTIYSRLAYQQSCYENISNWHMARVVDYPDYSKVNCPNAEWVAQNHFEIPMVSSLTDEQVNYIAENIIEFFKINK